jgi:hypothetical protein
LTIITREGRRPVPTTLLNGQEFIALDELASLFQLTVREDALVGGITVTYKGRTIVASADQAMASINGRVVTLPAPVARVGRRLFVPIDFIPRALAPIYDSPIDLRRASRLLIVGTIRVARVVVRIDAAGPPTRATIEVTPALLVSAAFDAGRVLVRIEADVLDAPPPPAAAGLIEQIRTGDQTTTVAIALNARAGTPRVSTTTSTESTRVSIEIPLAAQSQDTTASPVPPPATPPLRRTRSRANRCRLSRNRTAKLQTMVTMPATEAMTLACTGRRARLKTDHASSARRLKHSSRRAWHASSRRDGTAARQLTSGRHCE